MNDLRSLLREGDPIRHEGEMPAEVHRMRRHVLSASMQSQAMSGRILTVAFATGLLAAVVAAGWFVQPAPINSEVVRPVATRSQLHISTPGGTRVIWIFNSELDVR